MRLKKVIFLVGVVFLSFCLVGNVAAENKDGGVSFSTSAGKFWFDKDYPLQDNTQAGVTASSNITKNWGVELGVNYVDSSLTSTWLGDKEDVRMYFVHLDGLYHFWPEKQFVPYVIAGFGGLVFDLDSVGTESDYSVNYGAGFKLFLLDEVALRGDVRNVISWDDVTDPNETYSNWMASIGLSFQFGGTPAVLPDGDADGDGVKDSMDKCPNTPPGSTVNSVGCFADTDGDGVFDYLDKCPNTPNAAKVDMSGCPLDTDGDGVPDFLDKCPATPAGTEVDKKGCPVVTVKDSDGDGVMDADDKCPGTPKGAKVNVRGCWIIEGLLYKTGRSKIDPKSEPGLNEVVAIMKENPALKIEIQGHTDSQGPLEVNNSLSRKRAQAVKDYMVTKGVPADRLTAVGFGPAKPVAPNDTAAGRAKNRRVVLNPM